MSGHSTPVRILIGDDSELVRRGIKQLLAAEPNLQVCGEAVDGPDVLRKARELSPDLVLLDISMPGQSGLEAASLLRQELPSIDIIMMSQHDPAHFLPRALAAGARACVDKTRLASDLLPAIAALDPSSGKFRNANSHSQ
jgi:DNA-binding NarL/FixJ family response regulator